MKVIIKINTSIFRILTGMFILVVFIVACRPAEHNHDHGHSHGGAWTAAGEDDHGDETQFTSLTKGQIASIDLAWGKLEQKQLTASLKANGFLRVPNQNKADITAVLGGTVTSIDVQAGTTVRKGQTIATITNPTFVSMQEEYLTLGEKMLLAEIELNRQKELQKSNANAAKQVQFAESEFRMLQTRQTSLRKQLELVGLNTKDLKSENIQTAVRITSPIQGSISEVKVNLGTYVDANTALAEVVDHRQLHLDLYVFEKDLHMLKTGQTIHFSLTNNPGKEYDAKIFGISNTFEPETKAIAVHATVEGDKQGLIDGMSITALISLEQATVDALPTEAIVNYQGQDFIFIRSKSLSDLNSTDKNTIEFEKIPVRKGTTDIGYSEVTLLKDISDTTSIVVKGAFFLLAKMTNEGEAHSH